MNLINDAWIPVRRADGSVENIQPWRVTEDIEDEKRRILAVASPRPDFDGALAQFLIGLLQTTCTPHSCSTWRSWRKDKVPTPKQLNCLFGTVEKAFNLCCDNGPLFMQERLGEKGKSHPVFYLLIGSPTDNALKLGIDHFIKRPSNSEVLCRKCAAAALFTLQSFAPSGGGGGEGKFTSLRGGGPLTTIVLGDCLWESLWLNVLFGTQFSTTNHDEKTFPWLKLESFITAENPVKTIHSVDMNPEHVFWGMPRRIKLQFSADANQKRRCSICSNTDEIICTGFQDTTGGLTYQFESIVTGEDGKIKKVKNPSWASPQHPLSPYNRGPDKIIPPTAVHPQEGGIGYRHWMGLIENSATNKAEKIPALVVTQFRSLPEAENGRLWAFGYDMDNMKARCWYDAVMPILALPEGKEASDLFKALVEQSVLAAILAADEVRRRTKTAMAGDGDLRGDLSFFTSHFWGATETAFFTHAHRLRDMAKSGQSEQETMEEWLSELREKALLTFDRYASTGDFDIVNPRRIALARNQLAKTISGRRMRQTLNLPIPRKDKPKKRIGD
jgi:CRISPR system Cascade subunit CasA